MRAAAANILQSMRNVYGKPLTRVPASEAEYGQLDLGMYRRMRAIFEAAGFAYLCDYAVREINESPTSLLAPTMIRVCVAREDGMLVAYYQKRPRWQRLGNKLLTGLMNGRWIDAPAMFLKASRVRHCVEFSTEFADGGFVTTSNAEGAASIGMPAQLDTRFHPYGTAMEVLLADHRARVAAAMQKRNGESPLPLRDIDALMARLARESALKSAHRAAIGWVTHAELLKLSGGKPELADAIHAEIRTLLREGA